MAKTIFFIEDDKFLLSVYGARLKKQGYTVILLDSGKGAHEKIREVQPDLVIIDLIMPVIDGFKVLEELKQDELTTHIPVFIVSRLDQAEDISKTKNLGAARHLVKTRESINDIFDAITEQIGR